MSGPALFLDYFLNDTSADHATLTSPSFTPAVGEILVVKAFSANNTMVASPSGGGLTWTQQVTAPGTNAYATVFTSSPVTVSSPMTVAIAFSNANSQHAVWLERWTGAQVAGTPKVGSGTANNTSPATITVNTAAPNSVVTWICGDFNGSTGAVTWDNATPDPSNSGFFQSSGLYGVYSAYATTTTAGNQTTGVQTPTLSYSMAGVEIEAAASSINGGASLVGVTSAGPGTTITFSSVCKKHGLAVVVSGFTGSGTARVNLEISMDGTNWTTLPGAVAITGNGTYAWSGGPAPALYARARLQALPATITGITVGAILACE